jgi:Uma2 family endonuclease
MSTISIQRAIERFNHSNYSPGIEANRNKMSGDLCLLPVPSMERQAISLRIASALLQHIEAGKLGRVLQAPCGIILSTRLIQPDVLFVTRGRRGIIGKSNLHGAPDLIVEVLSPGMQENDLRAKRRLYAFFEVKEYWIVDPDATTIEVLVWSELGYVSAGNFGRSDWLYSPLLPGLNLPLSRVFKADED